MSDAFEIPDDAEHAEVVAFVTTTTDALWPLLTTGAGLEQWWWPMFDDTRYEIDAQEGGTYRIRTATGGFGVQGRYLELDEGRRIVQSWDWLEGEEFAPQPSQLVIVDLEERDGGTLVTVRQTALMDEVDDFRQGWQDCLTRLEELFDA
ncbi:SRPBCC family protein [Agrococcus beijingensis]|uniref:SRPBCC family protein n=1 Tax=Agrococcus beijingensis TaxID=3068634 RepID=UPI00274234BF|nr:SRPBCC family protein [Agrococcus sp. REN33]